MARQRATRKRLTLCTSCDEPLYVDVTAKSVSCAACNQRVICEPLSIKEYIAVRYLKVANTVEITKKGFVVACVRADDLTVDGRLKGEAIVLQRIHLKKKAEVIGNVRARSLRLDLGAKLVGDVRIGPDEMPELERAAEFARAHAAETG